jgi:RNA polymerase sigma factor (sigma-70 family)
MPKLLKGGYLLTRDLDLTEDVVQGTLLRVFRNWDSAREAPGAYSQKTLITVCRDLWRHQQRQPREVALDPALAADAADIGDRLAERDALERSLLMLTEQQREILVLRFFFDLSVAETARLLNVAEGTVKSASHRGLSELRQLLSPTAEEVRNVERRR